MSFLHQRQACGGLLSIGGIHTPNTSVCPHVCTSPYIHAPPYPNTSVCSPIPYVPHMSLVLGGNLYTPCLGVFWGASVDICQAFLCLSLHPFASQFTTVILAVLQHYGLLLYWTGCLWMSARLHAVVPFYAVFSLCLKLWYIISPLNGYHGPQ